MNEMKILYLSKDNVADINLSMPDIIQSLEDMFRLKGEGRTEMPPKPGIHTRKDAFIHAMPAYIPDMNAAGMKWVAGYPDNHKSGLPYITGLQIMNNPENGIPLAMMDCTWITAKRTGAATAVAAKYLARPNSEVVSMIGCGVQGESNLEALMVVQEQVKTVIVYDLFEPIMDAYIAKMKRAFPTVEFIKAVTPKDAIVESDIVVTTGPILKNPNPVIEADWFKEGAFASPVDFDSYWKPDALKIADKFCTDDRAQMHYYKQEGYFQHIPDVYADLGEIVSGRKVGRTNDRERTISINLGLALEDMAVGKRVYELAMQMNIGTWLPL